MRRNERYEMVGREMIKEKPDSETDRGNKRNVTKKKGGREANEKEQQQKKKNRVRDIEKGREKRREENERDRESNCLEFCLEGSLIFCRGTDRYIRNVL